MANWCNTAYVIEGDAKELNDLYKLMKELEEREQMPEENSSGMTWLGYLVDVLGGDRNEMQCRGFWYNLHFDGKLIRFDTTTIWISCNTVFDLAGEKFPTLRYYYQAEEHGMAQYWSNDKEGKYFPDKYIVDLVTPNGEWLASYFTNLTEVFESLEEMTGLSVKSQQDVDKLVKQWHKENSNAYCHIHEFM